VDEMTFVPMPAGQLTVPLSGDRSIAVREHDWKRIRSHVELLKPPMPGLSSAAWTILGIGVSSLLGWLTWKPAEAQLLSGAKVEFAFVSPLLGVIGVASIIVAAVFFAMAFQLRRTAGLSALAVVGEMDEIFRPYKESQVASVSREPEAKTADEHVERHNVGSMRIADFDPEVVRRGAETVASVLASAPSRDNGDLILVRGDTIEHKEFGRGVVAGVTGEGAKRVAEVYFAESGRKRLLIRIAPIEVIRRFD